MKTKPILTVLALSLFAAPLLADTTVPNNTTVTSGQTLQVLDPGKVSTTGAVNVQSGGKAVFVGGTGVTLSPGFQAGAGSLFRASRDMNLAGLTDLTDTDFDGLPDAWEILHFGNLTTTTGTADSDGDGVSNGNEYYAGSNPLVNENTAGMPGSVQVVVKTPNGKFQGVTTAWAIIPVP